MIESQGPSERSTGGWKAKLVKEYILANPGATIKEIVRLTRTAERTVSRVRQELIRTGAIAPAAVGRPPANVPEGEAADEAVIRRDIEAAISAGNTKVLTREERRQRLSLFADHQRVPHAARIAALKELEATEPPAEEKKLGPGVPLTREDRIVRASLVIEALLDIDGVAATRDALDRAGALAAIEDLELATSRDPNYPLSPNAQDFIDKITDVEPPS